MVVVSQGFFAGFFSKRDNAGIAAATACRRRAKSARAAATSERARHTISARLSPVRARAAKMFDEFGGLLGAFGEVG